MGDDGPRTWSPEELLPLADRPLATLLISATLKFRLRCEAGIRTRGGHCRVKAAGKGCAQRYPCQRIKHQLPVSLVIASCGNVANRLDGDLQKLRCYVACFTSMSSVCFNFTHHSSGHFPH